MRFAYGDVSPHGQGYSQANRYRVCYLSSRIVLFTDEKIRTGGKYHFRKLPKCELNLHVPTFLIEILISLRNYNIGRITSRVEYTFV